jgi:signal transduction histidine kinase
MAVTGYLSGGYAEASSLWMREAARRDRLLMQAERLKTLRSMSVAIIHEIAQPLTTLSMEARHLAALTVSDGADPREMAETAALVARKSASVSEIVKRLRRFGSGAPVAPSRLQVDALVRDAVALVEPEARSCDLDVSVSCDSGLAVRGRDIELQQALVNLLRNAIAATGSGGTVQVRVEADPQMVTLKVVDPGGAEPRAPGMGLGLLISRTIAEAHDGEIRSSTDGASGSCYALCLPLADRGDAR